MTVVLWALTVPEWEGTGIRTWSHTAKRLSKSNRGVPPVLPSKSCFLLPSCVLWAICPQPCRLRVARSQKSQGKKMPMPVQPSSFLPLPVMMNPSRAQALCHWPALTLPQWVSEMEKKFLLQGHRKRLQSSQQRGNTRHRRPNLQPDFWS